MEILIPLFVYIIKQSLKYLKLKQNLLYIVRYYIDVFLHTLVIGLIQKYVL